MVGLRKRRQAPDEIVMAAEIISQHHENSSYLDKNLDPFGFMLISDPAEC